MSKGRTILLVVLAFVFGCVLTVVVVSAVDSSEKVRRMRSAYEAAKQVWEAEDVQSSDATSQSTEATSQGAEAESQNSVAVIQSSNVESQNSGSNQHGITNQSGTTPFEINGKLSVVGTNLVNKDEKPVLLQGVSTHGLGWFPSYINRDALALMRDDWGIDSIRLSMYTAERGGYCTDGNQNYLKELIYGGVKNATDLGLYVIIDWHILSDNNPNTYVDEAKAFFAEISKAFADNDNIIYEICNEPNSGTTWNDIRQYAYEVIPVIKENDEDAVILVGTPNWCQDPMDVASAPIVEYSNIMYTFHFYAATHKENYRNRLLDALNAGVPVYVSEFGACEASGDGILDFHEAESWISLLNEKGISYCIWNLSNKDEACALLSKDCYAYNNWTYNDLSDAGKWYCGILANKPDLSNIYPGSTSSPVGNMIREYQESLKSGN